MLLTNYYALYSIVVIIIITVLPLMHLYLLS